MRDDMPQDEPIPEQIETSLTPLGHVTLRRTVVITIVLLAIGATVGATLRYYLSIWSAERFGTDFPYGTLIINVTGSLILGCFLTLANSRLQFGPNLRVLIATGFCGGYTTFSTFSYETVSLLTEGKYLAASVNAFGSVALGLVGVGVGAALAHVFV